MRESHQYIWLSFNRCVAYKAHVDVQSIIIYKDIMMNKTLLASPGTTFRHHHA